MMMSRPPGKRDDAVIRRAIQSFIDGEKTETIAEAHGVSQPTISYWINRHGKRLFGDKLKLRAPGRPQLSAPSDRDKDILKMHKDGVPQVQIAAKFGITRSRVSKVIDIWTVRLGTKGTARPSP